MTIGGIDEAGRGCVIGPLVMAAVALSKGAQKRLLRAGVRDSKTLTPARREELARAVRKAATPCALMSAGPAEIDQTNLNALEARISGRLVRLLGAPVVVLDVPATGRGIENYVRAVRYHAGPGPVTLIGENFADANHVAVAAASILAKVARDRAVGRLRRRHGDFGSGYPGDEKTIAFLRAAWARDGRFPDFVRRKWKTLERITGVPSPHLFDAREDSPLRTQGARRS